MVLGTVKEPLVESRHDEDDSDQSSDQQRQI